ncbi:desulfoferrodoxin [Clostridium manihotivorum]|uniref:Desulfoferrodoxin n=1 Tax=Clostridium manihotivorum TaxID=2320868 RepID=A0A3R5R1U5_9CLOT|nr:desulfoferrodoxin [Clostridium manihotivorum]QAA34803.1 desulfoferrodoxin [Clostridium manihotivorum]
MTEANQVYKCEICGNIVEVVNKAGGTLVCCGQPMTLKKENTTDGAKEKHVPVVEAVEGGVLVKVGEVAHPMTEEHLIQWVEVVTETTVLRKNFKAGDKPEAFFKLGEEKVVAVREYCNLHGLWKVEL